MLTLPVLIANAACFAKGIRTLIARAPNMDSLIAIGSGAAVLSGIASLYGMAHALGHGDTARAAVLAGNLYFESAATILTLIALGRYLEARAKGKTSEAITRLLALAPKTARRIDNAIAWAKKLNADGVILFCHWGCKQTMGLSTLAKRRLEEAGLPTLVLDGDGCDSRNVADGQMVTRVGAFLEQLEGMDA